ncbi:WXG100 family type VII secretion target [Salininema proteolyticum]|uniref:WXG100 family type VII secretion target n=1 Tax=Salininema proteolyticum TaxID=1607685 RepID=A0ABV8TX35_9ACTN
MTGKGKDFYKDQYTHDQLWESLMKGDPDEVSFAPALWQRLGDGMDMAKDELNGLVAELTKGWEGEAADAFTEEMQRIISYCTERSAEIAQIEPKIIEPLATSLTRAQKEANKTGDLGEFSLDPQYNLTFEEFVERRSMELGIEDDEDAQRTRRPRFEKEYGEYEEDRHDRMATVVGDLGDDYSEVEDDSDTSGRPPDGDPGLPGSDSYEREDFTRGREKPDFSTPKPRRDEDDDGSDSFGDGSWGGSGYGGDGSAGGGLAGSSGGGSGRSAYPGSGGAAGVVSGGGDQSRGGAGMTGPSSAGSGTGSAGPRMAATPGGGAPVQQSGESKDRKSSDNLINDSFFWIEQDDDEELDDFDPTREQY